ncbi:unnamed protein product, partial [marine sediment metagenome]
MEQQIPVWALWVGPLVNIGLLIAGFAGLIYRAGQAQSDLSNLNNWMQHIADESDTNT